MGIRLPASLLMLLALTIAMPSTGRDTEPLPTTSSTHSHGRSDQAPGGFKVKVNVDLVPIDAVVRGPSGAYIGNLVGDNFAVFDNGVRQPLTHFSHDQLPLAVALVVDCSPSIKTWLGDLKNAALSALQLLKSEDQVVLFSFDQCPTQLTGLTTDRSQIIEGLEKVKVGPQTNIYEAVYAATLFLSNKAPDHGRAVLIISDNYSGLFPRTEQATLRGLQETATTLLSIRTPGENTRAVVGPGAVERMAKETGGEVLILDNEQELAMTLQEAISNLKSRYHLAFSPSNSESDANLHKLEVKLVPTKSCPGCKVLARKGYYASSERIRPGAGAWSGAASSYSCSGRLPDTYINATMTTAIRAEPEYKDIALEARITPENASAAQGPIRVDLKIDPATIRFNRLDDCYTGGVRIMILGSDDKERRLNEQWKTIDLRLQEDAYRALLTSKIPFSTTIPLLPSLRTLYIVVFDPSSNALTSRAFQVRGASPRKPGAEPAPVAMPQIPAGAQIPTIKVEVKQVLVPVVVTDAKGHTVPGLRLGDFKVFEDGVPQQLVSVGTEVEGGDRLFPPAPPSTARSTLEAKRGSPKAGNTPGRVCLIVIDTLNSEFGNFSAVRGALKKMFREEMPGGALYGLVTLGKETRVVHPWTTDSAALVRVLDEKSVTKAILESEQSNLAAQESQLIHMLQDYCEKNSCPARGSFSLRDSDLMAIRSFATSSAELRSWKLKAYLRELRGLVEQLGDVPGRRTLVMLSDGFAIQPGRDLFDLIGMYVGPSKVFTSPVGPLNAELREVLRAAQQRDTAFYTIDSRGLYVVPLGDEGVGTAPRPSGRTAFATPQRQQQRETLAAQKTDGLRELADQTGGLFFANNNDIFLGLRRAVEDGHAYYVLSYVSTNSESDGKFRKIQIEISDKQLSVRSKPGYWAPAKQ
jgi:Ca-activated chloride channel homolog